MERVSPTWDALMRSIAPNSGARFVESILDAMAEFIICYDDDLKVLWANKAAAEDAGSTREEMIGRNFFEVACRLDKPCEGCPVVKGLSSDGVEIIESNVYSGRLFYTRSHPVYCGGTRLPVRLFMAQDISHLKSRYSVTEILALISDVFRSHKDLPAVCNDLITVIARRFDYPVGYIALHDEKKGEMVKVGGVDFSGNARLTGSRALSRCFPWGPLKDLSVVNVTGGSRVGELTGSALEEAGVQAVLVVPLAIEGRVIGEMALLDFKERLESNLMLDGLQAVANRLGAEIHRRQTDEKLTEEQNFTNAVLNNAGPLIMVLDQSGTIVRFNAACERLIGRPHEEVYGTSVWDYVVDSRETDAIRSMFPLTAESGGSPSFEGYWMDREGQKRLISWSYSLMGSEKEGGVHAVFIGIDITEKRRAEEEAALRRRQLLEADKLASLGILASGVAHEINNPNNFIMMNTPILRNAWRDVSPILDQYAREYGDFTVANLPYTEMREEVPHLFAGIEAGSERISTIVAEVKNRAKDTTPEGRQAVNVNDIVTSTVGLLSHEIKRLTRSLSVKCSPRVPFVQGNAQRLEQVLVNLIQNACQALPDQSKEVLIETFHRKEDDRVVVSIADEGVGIPLEHMSLIFEPFFTTKSDRGGTGLGLSVCDGIVKEHNGRLEVVSEPGKGTKVLLSLPADHSGKKKDRES